MSLLYMSSSSPSFCAREFRTPFRPTSHQNPYLCSCLRSRTTPIQSDHLALSTLFSISPQHRYVVIERFSFLVACNARSEDLNRTFSPRANLYTLTCRANGAACANRQSITDLAHCGDAHMNIAWYFLVAGRRQAHATTLREFVAKRRRRRRGVVPRILADARFSLLEVFRKGEKTDIWVLLIVFRKGVEERGAGHLDLSLLLLKTLTTRQT